MARAGRAGPDRLGAAGLADLTGVRIEFACPACDWVSRVIPSFAHQRGRCPACLEWLVVPDPGEPAPPPGDVTALGIRAQLTSAEVESEAPDPDLHPCPFCGESIRAAAKKCRFCGEFLETESRDWLGGEERPPLASPGARLLACLADRVLLPLPAYALVWEAISAGNRSDAAGIGVMGGVILLILTAFQWFRIHRDGRSLGKSWLGIKIVRQDGTPAGFSHGVVLRSLPLALLVLIALALPITWVGFVFNAVLVLGSDRRCGHDYLADTVVINA